MCSNGSTQRDESPTLSAMEQSIEDAMNTPAAQATIAASHAANKGPSNGRPFNHQEMTQELVDNLNRKTASR